MKQTTHAFMFFLFLSVLSLGLAGCDLINPPKKENKKDTVAGTPAAAEEAAPAQGLLPGDVIARVGDWTLTTEQFDQRLKLLKQGLPDFDENKLGNKESVLNELVRQQLLVKDAETSGIGRQKEIAEAVEDFRRTLLVQELANRLTKDIVATEKEAQEYYDQNKGLFVDPIEWKVREIVAADEAAAKNILVQVLQGGDFSEIARAQSKAKTASSGGQLPVFKKAPFAAMQTAIASLDAGGVSSVFKGLDGFYVIKVDDKKGGNAKSFSSVKADLVSGLTLRKQQEAILEHIDQLARKTKVEINKEIVGGKK
ncbi:MAG: peptidyl-prolyl cis-trans isomerase [Candidatus Omnitrophica bacterium]|nr:peptidyl-prolyl cis-trans isomerase [Candidatus Omnitrophota bacterium]